MPEGIQKMLDRVLTVRGITTLTYVLIVIFLLIYLRIVLGGGILRRIRSLFSAAADEMEVEEDNSKKKKRFGKAFKANPEYELDMTGGSGIGTVSEALARQTEIKTLNGEAVDNTFIEDYIPDADDNTDSLANEPEIDALSDEPEIEAEEPKEEVEEYKGLDDMFILNGLKFSFDGFAIGESYDVIPKDESEEEYKAVLTSMEDMEVTQSSVEEETEENAVEDAEIVEEEKENALCDTSNADTFSPDSTCVMPEETEQE